MTNGVDLSKLTNNKVVSNRRVTYIKIVRRRLSRQIKVLISSGPLPTIDLAIALLVNQKGVRSLANIK